MDATAGSGCALDTQPRRFVASLPGLRRNPHRLEHGCRIRKRPVHQQVGPGSRPRQCRVLGEQPARRHRRATRVRRIADAGHDLGPDTRQPLAAKLAEFPLPYRYQDVNQLAVTDDAASLLVSTDISGPQGYGAMSRADLWRLTAGQPPTMTGLPADAAFGPDGAEYYVCTAGVNNSNKPTQTVIMAIDTATGATDRTIELGTNGVCPARTADGEHVVIDHAVTPPNTSTRAVIVSLLTGKAYDVTVLADSGDLPAAADPITRWPLADPRISARDLPDGGLVGRECWRGSTTCSRLSGGCDQVVSTQPDDFKISTYVLSDDGRYIVGSGSDGTLNARDASTGQILGTLRKDPPNEAGMPFDTVDAGTNLYRLYRTPSSDQAAYSEWSLPELRPLAHYDLPPAPGFGPPSSAYIATTPDRLYALVSRGRALSVFDRHTSKQIAETAVIGPTGPTAPSDTGRTLLVNPRDPDQLITTSTDGKIVAWSVSRRNETVTLPIALSGSESGRHSVLRGRNPALLHRQEQRSADLERRELDADATGVRRAADERHPRRHPGRVRRPQPVRR